MRHKQARGYTLVEILTVVCIVAILGSLLFAVSAPAREKAREASCMGQIRQIYTAVHLYSNDFDGEEEIPGISNISFGFLNSPTFLTGYVPSKEVLYCPNTPEWAKSKIASSYRWRLPNMHMPEDASAAYVKANDALLQEIKDRGSAYPFLVCEVHDLTYYWPREDYLNPMFSPMFVIEAGLDGHISSGRRPYVRSDWLKGLSMLP